MDKYAWACTSYCWLNLASEERTGEEEMKRNVMLVPKIKMAVLLLSLTTAWTA
jgi:hypothetical protein